MRLDIYLTEKGFCKSRTAAQSVIKSGGVLLDGKVCAKPSADVGEDSRVEITAELPKYVGRGGLKLEKALDFFSIDINGAVCVDIGASTGGFTDCMLQNGAVKVFAVDVGTGQLDGSLLADKRVVSLEKTDIRDFSFETLPEELSGGVTAADFIGTDVSFISLKLVLPHIFRLLKSGGSAVALIKPQFEAGRSALNKKGIVTNEKLRAKIVEELRRFAEQCGFAVGGITESPITGGDGNVEYLMWLKKIRETEYERVMRAYRL
jgi:23S rRNA (cytidine1920-2'-O)/16S rRNA (cytidine1409-2'-O)-methyltransferase